MDKLYVGWELKAKKYKKKVLEYKNENFVKMCWEEKADGK